MDMKEVQIPRIKLRNFLADQLTQKVLQMNEETLYSMIRYEGIGGFNKMSDNDMFVMLVEHIPEFRLVTLFNTDDKNIIVTIKPEYVDSEDDILVDITRIMQLKFI
jgi:hypothetical protein